jgi:hypothetical protein
MGSFEFFVFSFELGMDSCPCLRRGDDPAQE